MNKKVQFIDWGVTDYQDAWDRQQELFQAVVNTKLNNTRNGVDVPTNNYLIFTEHEHVYTLGKSGDAEHLLLNNMELSQKHAKFYKIDRGGDITYHGPGQIVGYPILDLDNFFTDIHKYLRTLEEAIILTLGDYGIQGTRSEGFTGVWLDPDTARARKICAMGVRASRWVTMHGFAFNVNADLSYFDNIVPCGISDKQVTSLAKELGETVDVKEVKEKLKTHLGELFQMDFTS